MKRIFVLLLLGVAFVLPSAFAQKDNRAASSSSKEDDVREAVFRYEFKAVNRQADFFFIGINEKNPSDEFMARFRDDIPAVRPISDARHEKKPIPTIVDKKTDKDGIIFRVGAVKWISETRADVEGGYECGDLCDPTNGSYSVSLEGGHWVVGNFTPAASAAKP